MTDDKYKRVREIQEYISEIAKSVSWKIREGVEGLNLLDVMTRIEFYSKEALEALSKPRNCDVGTPEEQRSRFDKFCDSHSWDEIDGAHCSSSCPLYHGNCSRCESFEWAQMPYEAESEVKK